VASCKQSTSGVGTGDHTVFCLTHLGDGTEFTLIKFAEGTKLNDGGRMGAGQPETQERVPIQLDLDWME